MLTYLLFFVETLSTKCDDIQHDRFWAVRLISACHDSQCRQHVDNVDCSGHQDSSWLPARWWWWWSGFRKVGETAEGLSFGRKWRLLTLIRILLTLLVLSDAIIFVLIFSVPLIIDDCTQMREITQALGMSACLKSEMSNYLELVSFPTVTTHQRNIAQQCANQGWTGKLFFSRGRAGRGGARSKIYGAGQGGAGNPPPSPQCRARWGKGQNLRGGEGPGQRTSREVRWISNTIEMCHACKSIGINIPH